MWGCMNGQKVETFVEKYFKGVDAQQLSPIIDVARRSIQSGIGTGG